VFNGREPDEDRYDFDFAPLDSYSGRLWLMPSPRWAFQISVGRLNEVEPAQNGMPAENITRPTASLTYQQPLPKQGVWATTLAYGANVEDDVTTSAYLVESNLNLRERHILYGRAELVEKTAGDLVLDPVAFPDSDRVFRVGAFALGFQYQFGGFAGLVPGVGARVSLNIVPSALQPVYANDQSLGLALYVTLRPAPREMGGMMHGVIKEDTRMIPGEEHKEEPHGAPTGKPPHEKHQ
jgi:hypothetical protein